MGIQEYIRSQGYKPMRYVLINKEWKYIPNNNSSFSTMTNGGLEIRYVKEGFKEICYGLHEYNKPPTLICPRPKNLLFKELDKTKEDMMSDDPMNRVLQKYTAKEIFDDLILTNETN